ncbi:MAG: pyruvate kinase [Chloroflexota bacterium]|jgi:pyruvate kinase|nr:pyruvate kinase [Chloroflexota bacterium]
MSQSTLPLKKTKIVCTIGPASNNQETLEQMIAAGMNIVRINFAHGDFDSHRHTIATVRAAAAARGTRVAIMGDLPGPKMRIGKLAHEPIELVRGQSFIIQTEDVAGTLGRVSINLPGLPRVVRPGDRIFINDGMVQVTVIEVKGDEVHTEVRAGGELRSHKGVNFPGIDLGISAFTEEDRQFLAFAAEEKLDAISQSFVQDDRDIGAVRDAAKELDYHPLIIAKLERAKALENLDAILAGADGIMVARGDLGVEVPIEEIAIIQKDMIFRANLAGKPVITATHMLESMTIHSRPTRAEATDVANAILDGTDCLMLSGETAIGQYPVESVQMMADIAKYTETNRPRNMVADLLEEAMNKDEQIDQRDLLAVSINSAVRKLRPAIVFAPTVSGETARRVARFHLPIWIVAASPYEATAQRLQFTYGVCPEYLPMRPDNWEMYVRNWVQRNAVAGDLALLTRGASAHHRFGANILELIDLDTTTIDPLW